MSFPAGRIFLKKFYRIIFLCAFFQDKEWEDIKKMPEYTRLSKEFKKSK